MRRQSLILGIVLVVLVLVFYVYNSYFCYSEGFETLDDKVQDRFNPMAAQQDPLKNPAVTIGISEAEGAALRNMSEIALNIPSAVADGAGSYIQEMSDTTLSPRIDNENSFLGLVKMCKEKGKGDSPFSDSAFNENCGMCITSGSLTTGESFTTPTGVLVYKKDKEEAINTAISKGYPFARALPSLDSAVCVGANKDNNSLPVLAINQADYDAFRKRHDCRTFKKIGGQCGRCVSDQESTWIPPSGGKQPLTLYLWGSGKAKVSLATGFVSDLLPLSESSATPVPIGRVEEGTGIQIFVESDQGPYVYGAILSATAARGLYKLPIEKFMETDTISGSAPRRNGVKYFNDAKVFCNKMMAQSDKKSMNLSGFIPVTLVEADQLAAFDCPSAPLVQAQASAELLIDDVCLNPRGQGPGTYTEDCIRQTVLQGGCSTNGDWYKNPSKTVEDLGNYMNYIKTKATSGEVETDPAVAMGCKGVDISTPCDAFLNGGVPDKACMSYLYLNQSEKSKRIGRAYKNADTKYTSVLGNTIAFCRPRGELNPVNANGMGTLVGIAGGYKGLSGIEAVKTYLSDVYTKAVSSLDLNLEDDKGGRRTSWKKCFDMKIADPPLVTVVKNSINDVIDNRTNCLALAKNIDLPKSQGKVIGQVSLTQDYSLSFHITPRSTSGGWANIIHFTVNNKDSSRCPAIWFFPGDFRLHVRVGDTNDWNWGIDTEAIPINQKSSFRLECKGNQVTVSINDKVYTATQPTKRASGDAIVYCTDPWYTAANAYIENLCYNGGNSPAHISENYTCVKGWDHGGSDINCFFSGVNLQEMEKKCDRDPNCKSYNTFDQSSGCTKNQSSRNITNIESRVTNFCVKNN